MTIKTYDIQPLFATPYMRADLSHAITPEQVEHIKKLPMVQNQTNQISEDLYIFKHRELKRIANAVQEALAIYASEVMGIAQKLYVTQSWSLINRPGVGMHAHSHSNSVVSGSLYYTALPEPVSRMIFDRHTTYQRLELPPENDRRNLYNTPVNILTPKAGELLLFPSEMNHMVEANGASQPRHSIAFNCFIKGKLGDFRDVSELTL